MLKMLCSGCVYLGIERQVLWFVGALPFLLAADVYLTLRYFREEWPRTDCRLRSICHVRYAQAHVCVCVFLVMFLCVYASKHLLVYVPMCVCVPVCPVCMFLCRP